MDDPMRVSERRSLMAQQARACVLPPQAESLLSRLDQFDHRLRQLEEKQRLLPDCYFAADLQLRTPTPGRHHRSNSLSATHQVHLKATLIDRLHLVETRIRQLSFELDKEIGTGTSRRMDQNGGSDHHPVAAAEKNQESAMVGRSWRRDKMFTRGARELQTQKPRTKDLEEAVGAAEKTATSCAMFRDERPRIRLRKRWLPFGC